MSKPRDEYLCALGKRGQFRLSIINRANQNHINVLLNKLELQPSMYILDLGCGAGEITCQMAEKFPSVNVVAIDFSEEQIKAARENAASKKLNNVLFIVMSAYEVNNLQDRYRFDRIFIRWILGHLKEPQRVIESCKSLITPKGIIICEEGDIQTHHCESTNQSFLRCYSLFVSNIHKLQKIRGVDAEIGAKLPSLFNAAFREKASIETLHHQLILANTEQKEAVSTSFLDEVGQKFLDEDILTPKQLGELKEDLNKIAHDSEARIYYTADTSVTIKLR